MREFRRKANRLPAASYDGRRAYFLTLCTLERKRKFTETNLVNAMIEALKGACEEHAFGLYAYCFMPDHLHLILVGLADAANVPAVIRKFKGRGAATAREMGILNLWQ